MVIDNWTRYEIAMEELLKRLGKSHPLYSEAGTWMNWVQGFIDMDRRNDITDSEQWGKGVEHLSAITTEVFQVSFDEFVDQIAPPKPSPSPDEDEYSVFLCHSKDDSVLVRILYEELRQAGFKPWLDEIDLLAGQDWEFEIRQAIRKSDFFLACLTKNSVNKRGYVQKEIRIALDVLDEMPEGQIYLIPVRLNDCGVPERLRSRQWVDMFPDRQDGLRKIIRAVVKQNSIL